MSKSTRSNGSVKRTLRLVRPPHPSSPGKLVISQPVRKARGADHLLHHLPGRREGPGVPWAMVPSGGYSSVSYQLVAESVLYLLGQWDTMATPPRDQ